MKKNFRPVLPVGDESPILHSTVGLCMLAYDVHSMSCLPGETYYWLVLSASSWTRTSPSMSGESRKTYKFVNGQEINLGKRIVDAEDLSTSVKVLRLYE